MLDPTVITRISIGLRKQKQSLLGVPEEKNKLYNEHFDNEYVGATPFLNSEQKQ
jgi:hypothetical protein